MYIIAIQQTICIYPIMHADLGSILEISDTIV